MDSLGMALESKVEEKNDEKRKKLAALRARRRGMIAAFVDSQFMMSISVIVTFYALLGDDMRLLTTEKPADEWFNVITYVSIIYFTLDMLMQSYAKVDYFPGFHFFMDLIATASMLLDITWVANGLLYTETLEIGDKAEGGRTARIGASMGRVVRVLRLVRIVKLYKAFFETLQARAKARRRSREEDDEDPWGFGDHSRQVSQGTEDKEKQHQRESLVGRKLVAITTRRVIILVLTMMLALPLLNVPQQELYSSSQTWGADTVWQAYRRFEESQQPQLSYERSLLKYVYYHNWFDYARECDSCANQYYTHLFWIGFAAPQSKVVTETLRNHTAMAVVREATLQAWEQTVQERDRLPNAVYRMGALSANAKEALTTPWTTTCTYSDVEHLGTSLIGDLVGGRSVGCPGDLRPQESFRVHPMLLSRAAFSDWHICFFFDLRPIVRAESAFGLATTIFICFALCIAAWAFSKDANKLVLRPVERMIAKVGAIRDNPLIATKMADAEFEARQKVEDKKNMLFSSSASGWASPSRGSFGSVSNAVKAKNPWASSSMLGSFSDYATRQAMRYRRLQWLLERVRWFFEQHEDQELMETAVLEKTIIKLGSLLALGFGEAGANIVAHNMGAHSAGVDAMLPGQRVDCVIGSCRIRDFSATTVVLQGKVMTFVNQIAEIVHGLVNEFHGAANKNNGDTFLLIWRIEGLEPDRRWRMADMSMVAFARILAAIHTSPVLAKYRTHPGLQLFLGSSFRVDVTFGLHEGWAIEGAVGSEFKIDASYLSPNVNIAESLEKASKVYGVSIIASDMLVSMCSNDLQGMLRLIDRVVVSGCTMRLYSFDLDPQDLEVQVRRRRIKWNPRERFKARQTLEVVKEHKWHSVDLLEENRDIAIMRRRYKTEFLQIFNMGYQNYSEGEWRAARRLLMQSHAALGKKDGPAEALLAFMENPYQFEAPANWTGLHPLQGFRSGCTS